MEKFYKLILSVSLLLTLIFTTQCSSDYLDINPKGVLSENLIVSPSDMDGYVTSAYSYMPSLWYWDSHNPWMHGSIRSDDTYKGGGGMSDQAPWYEMEIFTAVTSNVGNNDGPWFRGYCGISRCNTAIRLLKTMDIADYPQKEVRLGEALFLRSWIYSNMKLFWKYIPYVDEVLETSAEAYEKIPNREEGQPNDLYLWEKILTSFKEAEERLPEKQPDGEKGRMNKYAAKAMVARTLLYMAYEQDDRHQVTNINKERLEEALRYCDEIISKEGSNVGLCSDFGDNFLPEYDNNTLESLWEIQYSIDDGTENGRVNWGDQLNAPWWTPYFNCCDFHKVSYNLANAFRTDADGLPLFETYNDIELKDNYKNFFGKNTFDPRFSHTVAVPGHPFKYDPTLLFDSLGSRQPAQYGYMNSLKEQVHPNCDCLYKPFYTQNSMNKKEIRYAEVLLWKAEILIQLNRHQEALPLINQVRERSANSTARLRLKDGSPILNYKIGFYKNDGKWTKEYAWNALKWETRLETACEGRRFFNLMRWGELQSTMNKYFDKEKTRYDWMRNAYFTAGRDEFKPIPQPQINWSKNLYKQNPGY